ncbi:MAG: internal scaffolding protein [Microvirus sp.]|nr:MAG: internal scaffolding protein [Microvirus sp.]
MAKPTPLPSPLQAGFSFYRPHQRVVFTNAITNPHTGEVTYPPSRTKQQFKDECDINNIIRAFKVTRQISHMRANAEQGTYTDLPDPLDFQESLNVVLAAEASFATLPAKVRERFGNDPQGFLAFMADPANQDEVIKLGLGTDNRPPKPSASTGEFILPDGPPAPEKPT